MTKTLLSSLEITTRPLTSNRDPLTQRQTKLIDRLEVQREMAKCLLENEVFTAYKEQLVTDEETGNKTKIRVPKTIKPWYYIVKGQYFIDVRYGSKSLELLKGKYAIAVGAKERLIEVISTIIEAVKAGELDQQLLAIKKVGQK